MKFYISTAFRETKEIIEIAKAADDLGYDGVGIPDHVINLETLATPYPYTSDGERRWQPFTDWPDPWVLVGALAQATTRLRFVTTVYIPAMRDPYSAAKAIGTAAYLADGRVELGVGVGWCEEEFTLMGQRFDRRGSAPTRCSSCFVRSGSRAGRSSTASSTRRRGWRCSPRRRTFPIYVGGLSDIALRRAARNDGWIGDLITTDRAIASVARLRELRAENGLSMEDFEILTPLTDAFTVPDYERAEVAGITAIVTMPWMFYSRRRRNSGREDRRHEALPQGPAPRRLTLPSLSAGSGRTVGAELPWPLPGLAVAHRRTRRPRRSSRSAGTQSRT